MYTPSPYAPPPIPGTTGFPDAMGNYAPTNNPHYTVANQFVPRNLHDVIRWSRYITMQSPVTTEVIRKLATYPITEIIPDTTSERLAERYKEIFVSLNLKPRLHDIGFEYYTIGNVFISIYFPIHRSLTCPGCKTVYNAKKANFTSFKKFEFVGTCPQCAYNGAFERSDAKSLDIKDINLITWDPINIAVNNNPITGESEYYYKIPNDVKKRVVTGDKLFVNSVPWGMIQAIQNNQDFKFDNESIFHLKNISAGHQIQGIAVPPLISLFQLVFYQATLRKANESISNDFMSPMRVIYPLPQTANSDPVVNMSMRNFRTHMTEALLRHKKDKGSVLIAPVPIGYQAVSGEGKNLLVSQEIQQAEESILLSLGVSKELLSGVTNWSSSTVGLRLLSNTMLSYTMQINALLNWLMPRISKYLGIETCPVKLTPFRLTDDDGLRNMLLQLYPEGGVSPSTLYEAFGRDYPEELKSIEKDAIMKATSDVNIKFAVDQAQFTASKQIVDHFDNNSDYRNMLAKAQTTAQQLMQVGDPNMQRQIMGQLRLEDYPQYLMVNSLIAEYQEQTMASNEVAASEPQEEEAIPDAGASKPSKPAAKAKKDTPSKENRDKGDK